jgi:hypothetical protein
VPIGNALKDKLLGVFPRELVTIFGWFEGDATSGFRATGKLPMSSTNLARGISGRANAGLPVSS